MAIRALAFILILAMIFSGIVYGDKARMPSELIPSIYEPDTMNREDPNLLIGGIGQKGPNPNQNYNYMEIAKQIGAMYVPTYYTGNVLTDADEVNSAALSIPTYVNGLKNFVNKSFNTIVAYSGGTATAVTALDKQGVTCHTLILISPMSAGAEAIASAIAAGSEFMWAPKGTASITANLAHNAYKNEIKHLFNSGVVDRIVVIQSAADQLPFGNFYQPRFKKGEISGVDVYDIELTTTGEEAHRDLFFVHAKSHLRLSSNGRVYYVPSSKDSFDLIHALKGHSGHVQSLAFSPDGQTLASGSDDFTAILWDVENGSEIRTLDGHSGEISGIAFSPNGQTLISGSQDCTVIMWDVKSGNKIGTFSDYPNLISCVAFSPNGQLIASGNSNNSINLWDVESGIRIRTLESPPIRELNDDYSIYNDYPTSIAFSPDGRTLASGSWGGVIKLHNVESGEAIRTWNIISYPVNCVLFSPDGESLAYGDGNNAVILLDIENGTETRKFQSNPLTSKGNPNFAVSVSFSPDGGTLASGSFSEITLWDVQTGEKIQTLDASYTVAFSPDGLTLASGNGNVESDALKYSINLWKV